MSDEMKACPFDGGEGWIVEDRDGPLLYRPQCKLCGGGLGGFVLRADAVAHWNRRALSRPQSAEEHVEELAAFMRPWLFGEARDLRFSAADRIANENLRDDARKHARLALEKALALTASPSPLGGEDLRASRDHAQTVSVALEFAGYLADAVDAFYAFTRSGDAETDHDARRDHWKALASASYEYRKRVPSSATPARGDKSRDEPPSPPTKPEQQPLAAGEGG